ncbi:cobalamin biosynthesis family protein [Vibrio sp. SM6]|uniref:Cobalamin biosynthesis family protein n=1 Tax=Vibrio agarilyticus TaxID=2726741 RepID=A0A7X8YG78_9VIBR|nr:cobalamin biosynthesis family protein [Vibrio agarilyticus]NLS12280.1 cobalamin biosynthesis family protein [Vibrio agarilyticus]
MEELLSPIYANGALLALWGALLFHWLLPIPHSAHPALLWHQFASLLASKVNRHHQPQQSALSGTLAWLLMMMPLLVLLMAAKPLVWEPALFEMALLMLALEWRGSEHFAKAAIHALSTEDKARSRTLLATSVNRETERLSNLGLGKASAETLIMGIGRNVICVLFWYALLGGIGALTYRFAMELARAWSPSRARFHPFGRSAIRFLALIELVPMRLFALTLLPGKSAAGVWQGLRTQAPHWPLPGPAWLLCTIGHKLQISLGGPAFYDGVRAERSKIGGRIAPSALHLAQVQALLTWRVTVWIVLISIILALVHQGL